MFSGESGNAQCDEFDASKPDQQSYCQPGEACLWYSWLKSDNDIATIRECFKPSILLGPISDPLRVQSECNVKDIAETPGSSINACLCDTDLCNANDGKGEPVALPQIADPPSRRRRPPATTRRPATRRPITRRPTRPPTTTQRTFRFPADDENELTDAELAALSQIGQFISGQNSVVPEEPRQKQPPKKQSQSSPPSSRIRPIVDAGLFFRLTGINADGKFEMACFFQVGL